MRSSALGDIILALPAVSALREALPDARITWLVEDRFADLLQGYADIDEVVVAPRRAWSRGLRRPTRWLATLADIRRFRRELRGRFDVALDFQGNLKSAALNLAAASRRRIGFARPHSREGNHLVNREHVTLPPGKVHRGDKDLALASALVDRPLRPVVPRFAQDPTAERAIRESLSRLELTDRPFAVLHPGTSRFGEFKRWPGERFADLGRRLDVERGLPCLVTWGPGEEPLAREVADAIGESGYVAPETAGFRSVLALLRRAHLCVGADTGITHLAATLGRPTVALFGPKDPAIYAPRGRNVRVVTHDIECRPCGLRSCPLGHIGCMTRLEPAAVLEAIHSLLDDPEPDERGSQTARGAP
jgi:lipopolysaccharide heptosyltransferase I